MDISQTELPKAEIRNREQAIRWLEELTTEMVAWRNESERQDIRFDAANKAAWTFLTKQGQVIGAMKTLRLVGLLDDRAYKEFNQRALNALIPKTIVAS